MQNNHPSNCKNCGAKLSNQLCDYCGTINGAKDAEETSLEVVAEEKVNTPAMTSPSNDMNTGCIVVIIAAGLIFFLFLFVKRGIDISPIPRTDTVKIDTSTYVPPVLNEASQYAMDELSSIDIDPATFKKLYKDARKNYVAGSIYIDDRTSPYSSYNDAIHLYIIHDNDQLVLRFLIYIKSEKELHIKRVVFNTDGEKTTCKWKFDQDYHDGIVMNVMIWK